MDRRHLTAAVAFAALSVTLPLHAQDPPKKSPTVTEVTYSLTETGDLRQTVEPGNYQLRLTELAPAADYRYRQESIRVNPRGITAVGLTSLGGCKILEDRVVGFRKVNDESDVSAAKQALREALEGDVTTCPERANEAKALIAATEVVLGPFEVTAERGFAVTVLRTDSGRSWRIELLPERQRYFFSYGFNAFRDQDEEYFAKPAGTDEAGKPQFQITPKADDEDYDVSPSVLLTILFPWEKAQRENWSFGISAGAGFDGKVTSPEIYLGPTLVIWDNIFLTAGALLHPQKRLLGEVSLTELTTTSLTDEQLHRTTHDWNWFIGMSFRFGKPQKSTDTKPTKENPEPAPKPTSAK